ncbi:MAG TPA: DUF4282 domain-containing protein [bacterium]|nr:DUF4282 domain-containing protein [bacterium]
MENQNPLRMLLDLSFTEFITIRVIKFLYIIGVIIAAIATIGLIAGGFTAGAGRGILFLLLSPIVFILYVLLARIWCEIIIVLFRIAENTSKIAEKK